MSRGRARFTQADVSRALRAVKKAGGGEVIIDPDGTIRIAIGTAAAKRTAETTEEMLDRELAEFVAEKHPVVL